MILIEDAEYERGEFGRVALREELLVNPDETLLVFCTNNRINGSLTNAIKVMCLLFFYLFSQETVGTILEESFVPLEKREGKRVGYYYT